MADISKEGGTILTTFHSSSHTNIYLHNVLKISIWSVMIVHVCAFNTAIYSCMYLYAAIYSCAQIFRVPYGALQSTQSSLATSATLHVHSIKTRLCIPGIPYATKKICATEIHKCNFLCPSLGLYIYTINWIRAIITEAHGGVEVYIHVASSVKL